MATAAEWTPHVVFGLNPAWVSSAILIATYAAIMTERVNRAIVAGVGATLMIVLGVLNQEAAIRGVDFNTIMLLAGMMLIVGVTRRTGVFEYLAIWSVKVARARPAGILVGLSVATAIVSALLDNVTTVLLVAPVTIAIARQLKVPAYPLLVGEIMASNIGGTATLVGDPPNIMIGSAAGLSFNAFLLNLTPVVLVILAANALIAATIHGMQPAASFGLATAVGITMSAALIAISRAMTRSRAKTAAACSPWTHAKRSRTPSCSSTAYRCWARCWWPLSWPASCTWSRAPSR